MVVYVPAGMIGGSEGIRDDTGASTFGFLAFGCCETVGNVGGSEVNCDETASVLANSRANQSSFLAELAVSVEENALATHLS